MTADLFKKLGRSVLRIIAALVVILGVPALGYLIWQPGSDAPLPDFADNAIWIGHGWLGDDAWFARCASDRFVSPREKTAKAEGNA